MTPDPLVSILIPCFNQRGTIVRALESIRTQTYRPLEIIVVDDGSQDGSAAGVENWSSRARDLQTRIIQQSNQGPAAARQAGLEASRGGFVQYLDADDLLEPDKVRPQVRYLLDHVEADGVYGDWKDRLSRNGVRIGPERRRTFPLQDFVAEIVAGKWIALHAFLLRRETAVSQRWDTRLGALEDTDYFLQLALGGARFDHLGGSDCAVYCRQAGAESRNRIDARWLEARLALHRNTQEALEARQLLESSRYRRAMATAYLGLAWRALLARHQEAFEQALRGAGDLLPERELCRIECMLRLHPWLGVRRSLKLQGLQERFKGTVKGALYPWIAFDAHLTWRENLEARWGS